MDIQPTPCFGDKVADKNYIVRPGAYAVIFDSTNRVAAIPGTTGYFLPGGGLEKGELPV